MLGVAGRGMKAGLQNFLDEFCWVTYCRSFLITLGLIFIAFFGFLLAQGLDFEAQTNLLLRLVFGVMVILGAVLVSVGLFSAKAKVEKWAENVSSGDLEVLAVMVIALPLYFVMSVVAKR